MLLDAPANLLGRVRSYINGDQVNRAVSVTADQADTVFGRSCEQISNAFWMSCDQVKCIVANVDGEQVKTVTMATVGACCLAYLCKRIYNSCYLDTYDKAVFITGCDSGFGKAAALEFRRRGYTVFAGCLNSEQAWETFKDVAGVSRESFHVIQLDVTKQDQIDGAVRYVTRWLELYPAYRLWCVVNNAGIPSFGPMEFVSTESYERVMDCNYFGSVRVTKAFLPLLRHRRPWAGRIIFVGSIGGYLPCPAVSAYGCSKAAMLYLADSLRMELHKFNIAVSCILPDSYMTNIQEPSTAVQLLNSEVERTDKEVLDHYGGEDYVGKLRRFLTEISPPRAKRDLSPVVNSILEAATVVHPKRRYYPMDTLIKIMAVIFDFAPNLYICMMTNFL